MYVMYANYCLLQGLLLDCRKRGILGVLSGCSDLPAAAAVVIYFVL